MMIQTKMMETQLKVFFKSLKKANTPLIIFGKKEKTAHRLPSSGKANCIWLCTKACQWGKKKKQINQSYSWNCFLSWTKLTVFPKHSLLTNSQSIVTLKCSSWIFLSFKKRELNHKIPTMPRPKKKTKMKAANSHLIYWIPKMLEAIRYLTGQSLKKKCLSDSAIPKISKWPNLKSETQKSN